MHNHPATVERWLELANPELTEQVRRTVRGGVTAPGLWAAVAGHPVLAARVRGVLSVLQSRMADHRDHAMWTVWISSARRALVPAPQSTSPKTRKPRPAAPAVAEEPPAITIATAPMPSSRSHMVAPVTFLAAAGRTSDNPGSSTDSQPHR